MGFLFHVPNYILGPDGKVGRENVEEMVIDTVRCISQSFHSTTKYGDTKTITNSMTEKKNFRNREKNQNHLW